MPKTSKTRFWASDSPRVIHTAQYFAWGMFGLNWERDGKAELQIVPETFAQRANTLTPGDTCPKYIEDVIEGHDKGLRKLTAFLETYTHDISARLSKEHDDPDYRFSPVEIFSMQEMCGFETTARGTSPWCDVFSGRDWDNFEYARDVLHYYRAGPGNPYAGAMGWLWLNATDSLLQHGPQSGSLFFSLYDNPFLSFSHSG